MSKLDELIKELCPNGVEYKKLGEVCNFQNGFAFKSTLFKENGEAILRITNISNGIINEEDLKYFLLGDYKENLGNYIVSKNDIVIAMSGATTGKIGINNTSKKFYLNQRVGKFIPNIVKLNNRFLYHFLLSKGLEILKISSVSGAQPNLSTENIKNLVIPVPPLEVQEEIAKILDNYTKSVEELKEKLNEELIARKNQYSWYRDYLLKFENKVKIVKLKDIATEMYRGNGIKREEIREIGIPCIRYGEIYTDYGISFEKTKSYTDENLIINKKYIDYGDILFAITGESVEEIGKSTAYIGKEKCLVGGDILVMKHKQDPVYLSYVLSTENAQKQKSKGKIKSKVVHTNATDIGEIEIPLPPLEVQKRIVEVLDNFEKICNDLNIGLPAEIEARQKQYEFYRNFLLTFKIENCTLPKTRQDKTRQDIIKLFMYIFGYIELELGEIFELKNGYTPSKSNPEYWLNGNINWFKIEDINTNGRILKNSIEKVNKKGIKGKLFPENTLIISTSATIGEYALITKEFLCNQRFTCLIVKGEYKNILLPMFLKHYAYILSKKCKENIKIGNFPSVDMDKFKKFLIPLPLLEEQQRIVDILDRFDKLCNDISEGLPAEIEARQKQYEYYREKLLTFKNIND
ncbi:restriction endonuclease subunit S [Fusobacterium polymorphum]|uniref:restriction endonuclease subunit S n=2 Tax=Fusobacterium nucleatum subsp. polymorphum TaxID=76857 RepID=UPI0030081B2E